MTLAHLWQTFLISASPIAELRLAIPLALYGYEMPWYWVLPISLLGNLLPVPFLLLFLKPVIKVLARFRPFKRVLDWVFQYALRRGRIAEKYHSIGLMVFVAIPLPGSGAWTGSILASLLDFKFKQAFISIALGVFIAGVIVVALSLLGWVGGIIAGVGLIILAILGMWKI